MKSIRASDIGTYLYCRRAWWYRQKGQESINQAEMNAGSELHRRHGRKVMRANMLRLTGFILMLGACILLATFVVSKFLGFA